MIMSVPVNLHIFLMLFIVSLLALAIQITIYVHYITINCIFRILWLIMKCLHLFLISLMLYSYFPYKNILISQYFSLPCITDCSAIHLFMDIWVISSVFLLYSHSVMSKSLWPHGLHCQASLSFTTSRILLKLTSIKSVMASNHLILCCPLLLLPSIFPSIRVFSNE